MHFIYKDEIDLGIDKKVKVFLKKCRKKSKVPQR